jgi:DNA processing protein
MEEKHWTLGFSKLPKVGLTTIKKIRDSFGSLEKAWHCKEADFFIKHGFKKEFSDFLILEKSKINLENELALLEKEDLPFLSVFDKDYPPLLEEISSPPPIIYYRGNIKLLSEKQLAVVGSRKISSYGQQVIEKIIPEIVRAGLIITSGLAIGVDYYAHQITLENEGLAVAVLGNGLSEKIMRRTSSYNLYRNIIRQSGVVISEFPPFFEASKFTFPVRNRIISGLSLGTLIIEAAEKSGSLITAKHALEQGREIFVIPGNIFSSQSVGANQLLKEGAKCVTNANDILETFNFSFNLSKKDSFISFEDETEEKIYKMLSFDPMPFDLLIKKIQLSPAELSAKISLMELKGLAKTIDGGRVVKN